MGVNCPWWTNKLKEESCTTGPLVPIDLWTIYSTREACCASNFPFSDVCDPVDLNEDPPTKHPTIALPEDDYDEIIPLRVQFTGLPENISMSKLKEELVTVLKRILLRLAEKVDGLKILSLEERVESSLLNRRSSRRARALSSEEFLYYNVQVLRVEGSKFGPAIISTIRDYYDEMLSQILTFSDTDNLGEDIALNVCTMNKGEYDLCAIQDIDTAASRSTPAKTSIVVNNDDEGLAGWAIALIVIIALSLVCCGGYAIAVMYFKDTDDDPKDFEKRLAIMDGGRSEAGGTRLAIMDGGASRAPSYNYSHRSGPSRRTIADGHEIVTVRSQDPSFYTLSTYGSKRRQARDPTLFISGQKDRPDPGMSVTSFRTRGGESSSSSRRYYSNEQHLKPKREPTMYVDGKVSADNPASKYLGDPAPMNVAEGQQTPIMYEDVYSAEEDCYKYNGDVRYGRGGVNRYNGEYDQSEPALTRKSTADYMHGLYDTSSDYEEVKSCRTQEPSVSTAKSKKSASNGHQNSFRTREPSVSGKSAFSKQSHWSKASKSSGVYSG